MNAAVQSKMTHDAYLAWEAAQPGKHEYYRGEVFAMVGTSRAHAEITRNLVSALHGLLMGRPCRAYSNDVKVRVAAADAYYYPDVFVTCSPRDLRADAVMSEPSVVFEVLSPSTAEYDRGMKFAAYRLVPSLQQYVLLDPDRLRIESYQRTDAGWLLVDVLADQPLLLPSLGLQLAWDDVFRYVAAEPT